MINYTYIYLYIAAILFIGIRAGKHVKSADGFAVNGRNTPFWTNVFSMSSAWIGAGSTLGCASMCYAYGISGFYLSIGVASAPSWPAWFLPKRSGQKTSPPFLS